MLEKLIESKTSARTNRRLRSLLLSVFTTVISILGVGLIYSLFTYNLAMADDNLEISTLLAPITNFDEAPKPVVEPRQQPSEKTVSNLPTRQENIQRPEESPVNVPKTVSVTPATQQSRPNSAFKIGIDDTNPSSFNSGTNTRGSGESSNGISGTTGKQTSLQKDETEVEPDIKQIKKITPVTTVRAPISKGVINGQAKNLVKPAYPQTAKAIGAGGEVKVQVTIDEEGRVISAVAVSGHPLLKSAAVNAARASTFTSTFLSEQKVKVTGVIVYNFTR